MEQLRDVGKLDRVGLFGICWSNVSNVGLLGFVGFLGDVGQQCNVGQQRYVG